MRIPLVPVSLLLLALAAGGEPRAARAQETKPTQASKLVAEYVAADDPATRAKLLKALAPHDDITPAEVATWVKFVKAEIAKKPKHDGKEVSTLGHKTWPLKYRLVGDGKGKKQSLVVTLHGGGGPQVNDGAWSREWQLWRNKAFDLLVAPRVWDETGVGWITKSAVEAVPALVNEIKRTYDIDTNRVYLVGSSLGSYGTCTIGSNHADYFAALGTTLGGQLEDWSWAENLRNTPITMHIGADDPRAPASRAAKAHLDELKAKDPEGYTFAYKEYAGAGHGLPPTAYAEVAEWVAQFTRNPAPKHVVWKPCEIYKDGESRNLPPVKRRFFWLGIDEPALGMKIDARIDRNDVRIATEKVEDFTVFLNEKLVDLKKPVKVVVDGRTRFDGKPKPSLIAIVESYVEKEDPEMVFTARIAVGK